MFMEQVSLSTSAKSTAGFNLHGNVDDMEGKNVREASILEHITSNRSSHIYFLPF